MSGIQIRNTYGKLQENTTNNDLRDRQFVTGSNVGSKKVGLDARIHGFYLVGATARIAEAGSSDTIVKLTAHDIKVGDVIRILTTANNIEEREASVKRVVDANNVELASIFSAAVAAGDTFDIMRSVTPRYTADGASLTSVTPSPVSFNLNSVITQVNEDTITPSNNAPLPVKITSASGPINITAGDLNVQTSHVGASADSMRIGDGTTELGIKPVTKEGLVHDADVLAKVEEVNVKTPALGEAAMAASVPVVIANNQTTIPVSMAAAAPLPADAATETTLAAQSAKITKCDTDTVTISAALPAGTNNIGDVDVLSLPSLPAGTNNIGDVDVLSLPALPAGTNNIGDVDVLSLPALPAGTNNIGDVDIASSVLPTGAATEAKQDDTITAIATAAAKMDVVSHVLHDASSTNITTAAYATLIADIGATSGKKVQIFNGQGTPFYIAVGAAASEVDKLIVCPGGFPDGGIEVNLPANARISAKAIGSNITAGTIILNIMG